MEKQDELSILEDLKEYIIDVGLSFIENPEKVLESFLELKGIHSIDMIDKLSSLLFFYHVNKVSINDLLKENELERQLLSSPIVKKEDLIREESPQIKPKLERIPASIEYQLDKRIIDNIESNDIDVCSDLIETLSDKELPYLKMFLLKKITELKNKIKKEIIKSPLTNIIKYQDDLTKYQLLFQILTEKNMPEETIIDEVSEQERSKIIFLPNHRNGTYIYGDIEKLLDNSEIIKNALNKIVSGYFLKTKDLSNIEGYDSKLFEYKQKNGIRIMYFQMGNGYIGIASIFFKDKQKSTKIESFYEEAVSRFNASQDYVFSHLSDPNFYIEQQELVGDIFDLLEKNNATTLSLKGGE